MKKIKKPGMVEEYFDLETYSKQLQEAVPVSRVYDPTRTILEKTHSPKIFRPGTSSGDRIRDKLVPTELARLQKGIDQSLFTPFTNNNIRTQFREPQSLFDQPQSFNNPQSFGRSSTFYRPMPTEPRPLGTRSTFTYTRPEMVTVEPVPVTSKPPTPLVQPLVPLTPTIGIYIPPLRAANRPEHIKHWLRKWRLTNRPLAAAFGQFLPQYGNSLWLLDTGTKNDKRNGKMK